MICFGKGATHAKDAMIARLQQDYARHFADSIDYEPDTLINDEKHPLIVSKNKSVTNERKIFSSPGDTFYTGDVVDCYNTKWLITEVDQNKQVYTSGIMQLCNSELIWQNQKTGEIIRRWVTAEKPYYSNLDESKVITVSSREFKVQVTYDDETSQINLDKRFMLEIIAGNPCTYKVTSVDSVTERFYEAGQTRGFLVLNLTQDLYNPETDNAELMICDYINPDSIQPTEPGEDISIKYSGTPTIRFGGSEKKFSATMVSGEPLHGLVIWKCEIEESKREKIRYRIDGNSIWIQAADDVTLVGDTVILTASIDNSSTLIEVEVVS